MNRTETETIHRGTSAVSSLTVYFDPLCPWTWKTAKWLFEVEGATDLRIEWRFYSLAEANGGNKSMTIPLSLLDYARQTGGNEGVERLYRALGAALHESNLGSGGSAYDSALRGATREAGLPDDALDRAMDDENTLHDVDAETQEAMDGFAAYGSPWLVAEGMSFGFNGPIISDAPTGQAAIDLWTHISYLLTNEQFYEIKRERQ
jgi:2-hydroxychromene-2-carboxylate isomerase